MPTSAATLDRVILIVLDGVGAGELPDAATYGDSGANTLGNLAREYQRRKQKTLQLPNLARLGLGRITPMPGVDPTEAREGAYGRATELSQGKDTTSGHWEMAGLVVQEAFPTFPSGFPAEVVDRWVRECALPGVLGNRTASGTEILEELGEEHLRTGKPILYTSADSVWQVAAHELTFGLQRLYDICKAARKICDELRVGRVIARPFVGNGRKGSPNPFQRTYNRKDYSLEPFGATYLDALREGGVKTMGIGKISSIYAGRGIDESQDTAGNADGVKTLLKTLREEPRGLVFCNLIDFDMLYGHRRDVEGFGASLEEFDRALPEIRQAMGPRDLLLISADHGNDPTCPGTDHTREFAPVLAYSPAMDPRAVDLGICPSFADLGATAVQALLPAGARSTGLAGRSLLHRLLPGWPGLPGRR